MGSARVWDAATRALRAAPAPGAKAGPSSAEAPATSESELAALVHAIVRATLDTRLAELSPQRRSELARELEQRLVEVFDRTALATPTAPAQATPAPNLVLPPGPATPTAEAPALAPLEPAPAVPEAASERALSPALRALALVLEDRLARLGGPLGARPDLRLLLAELVLAFRAHEEAPSAAGDDELGALDVLARRAAKLERSLHEARAALAYVSGLAHVEPGVASIYRQVQGLASDDPRHEQKSGALQKIFQANLDLRTRLEGEARGS